MSDRKRASAESAGIRRASTTSTIDIEQVPAIKKRKYRKHPKPDINAPKKPSPSAYHLFALAQGERLRKEGYGFEDIARETGARWRALSPQAVNELEAKTTQAKNQYRKDVASYKKSPEYKAYQEYLKRWMAKEEMKTRQESHQSTRQPSPPLQTNHQSTSTSSSPTSIGSDMPVLDWTTTGSSQASTEMDPLMMLRDDWFVMPALSTAEQLEWKWSADYDVTLAPDPLFPVQQMKTPDFFAAAPTMAMSSTISPTMLTQRQSYSF